MFLFVSNYRIISITKKYRPSKIYWFFLAKLNFQAFLTIYINFISFSVPNRRIFSAYIFHYNKIQKFQPCHSDSARIFYNKPVANLQTKALPTETKTFWTKYVIKKKQKLNFVATFNLEVGATMVQIAVLLMEATSLSTKWSIKILKQKNARVSGIKGHVLMEEDVNSRITSSIGQ